MNIYQLPEKKSLSESISLCTIDDIEIIRINHPKVQAAVSLHGGHLISFKPAGKKEVIFLSKKAIFSSSKAIRGGTPVCFPWFGKVASPSHGFARNSTWDLDTYTENTDTVTLTLTLKDNTQTQKLWPHAFHNQIVFTFGNDLDIKLTTTNTDTTPWAFSGALHTYFDIAASDQVAIYGAGRKYMDSTRDGKLCLNPKSKVTIDGEVDRIYYEQNNHLVIDDVAANRKLDVELTGANSTVIWCPSAQQSASMGDMADDSYKTMVCVESCIRSDKPVTVQPGESYVLGQSVRTEK